MKKAEFLTIIDPLIPKFYSFAFALVPDELQAQQIVTDSFSVFFIREKDFIQDLADDWEDKKVIKQFQKEMIKGFFEQIFKLGVKRANQLFSASKNDSPFYSELDSSSRGVLFLSRIMKMNTNEIKLVTDLDKHLVIEKIQNARVILDTFTPTEVSL
jgi:hypothetical protein